MRCIYKLMRCSRHKCPYGGVNGDVMLEHSLSKFPIYKAHVKVKAPFSNLVRWDSVEVDGIAVTWAVARVNFIPNLQNLLILRKEKNEIVKKKKTDLLSASTRIKPPDIIEHQLSTKLAVLPIGLDLERAVRCTFIGARPLNKCQCAEILTPIRILDSVDQGSVGLCTVRDGQSALIEIEQGWGPASKKRGKSAAPTRAHTQRLIQQC